MPLAAMDFEGQNAGIISFETIAVRMSHPYPYRYRQHPTDPSHLQQHYANFMLTGDDSWDAQMAKDTCMSRTRTHHFTNSMSD